MRRGTACAAGIEEHRVEVGARAHAARGTHADYRVETIELGDEARDVAGVHRVEGQARIPLRPRVEVEVRPELVGRLPLPLLPSADDRGRLVVRPGEEREHDRPRDVRPERERRDDAEAAAASAQGPVEVGLVLRVTRPELRVRRHDRRGDQVVAGETPASRHHADAPTEGEPGDPDGRAAPAGESGVRERRVDVDEPRTRADGDLLLPGLDRAQRARVDHQTRSGRPSAVAVAAASERERNAGLRGEGDARADVVRRGAPRHPLRPDPVEARVVEDPRRVVRRIAGPHERAAQASREGGPVRRGCGRWRRGRR